MKVYTVTQVSQEKKLGCYGVFTSSDEAEEFAINYAEKRGCPFHSEDEWNDEKTRIRFLHYTFEIKQWEINP